MKKYHFVISVLMVAVVAFAPRTLLAFDEVNVGYFSDVALEGYDAVEYFTQGAPVKGKKSHRFEWKQATWLFSSEANRDLFASNPQSYAPQYGGYCSNQMSLGNLSDIDPEVWRIIDNKLYLFGHDAGRIRWKQKTEQRISDADNHWDEFLSR